MDEELKRQLEKYKSYRIIQANYWMFYLRKDDEMCRIDGISDENRTITIINLDYENAKELKRCLEIYLRAYEDKYKCYG